MDPIAVAFLATGGVGLLVLLLALVLGDVGDLGDADGPAGSRRAARSVVPRSWRRLMGAVVAVRGVSMPDVTGHRLVGGERMDLGHVVRALLAHRDHLRRAAS